MNRNSVTHQFNDRGGALRRLVNFVFLTELMAANTHPTPYRFNNSPVGCVSDSVTHPFNDRAGALRRLVNFGFLTELIAANTHPTPYRFNNSPVAQ